MVNGLIKFRAGEETDRLGIKKAKSPYHVPWVWCEMMFSLSNGTYTLYGRGSKFPSHAWYINGLRVRKVMQAGDAIISLGRAGEIRTDLMNLYPVLEKGPENGNRLQVPLDDDRKYIDKPISVQNHSYTVYGGKTVYSSFRLDAIERLSRRIKQKISSSLF